MKSSGFEVCGYFLFRLYISRSFIAKGLINVATTVVFSAVHFFSVVSTCLHLLMARNGQEQALLQCILKICSDSILERKKYRGLPLP